MAQPLFKTLQAFLIMVFLAPFSYAQGDKPPAPELSYSAPVGARVVETDKLFPYNAVWVRQTRADEKDDWAVTGAVQEILILDEQGQWRHTQYQNSSLSDTKAVVTRMLDRETLRPLHFLRTIENGSEGAPVKIEFDIGPIDVKGRYSAGDGTTTPFQKELSMPMFDGSIVGLVIATLPLSGGYRETLPTSIPTLNATYWLEILVTGKIPYEVLTGEVIEVWEVTANWYNIDDRDWYPPGRDNWGGAYYIAVEPGGGVPFVVEYAHSTLIFAWDGVRREQTE